MPPSQRQDRPTILWFRRDLRLTDQAALAAALAENAPLIPVFILDDGEDGAHGQRRIGAAGRWWLHHSLARLSESLHQRGSGLVLRRGESVSTLLTLAEEVEAGAIHTGFMPDPAERAIDRAVADRLSDTGRGLHRHRTTLLHDPYRVRTQTGKSFGVFTPFAKAFEREVHVPPPAAAPNRLPPAALPPSDRLEDWRLLPKIPWDHGMAEEWTPGEAGATARLQRFVNAAVDDYAVRRDFAGETATSMLSPHLHWGEISPWQVWTEVGEAAGQAGIASFRREMIWREFAAHLLWHHPTVVTEPLRPEFKAFPWRQDDRQRDAWQRGRTGIPIVDAGMRQLWSLGWMHNRVRMITASFLVKHLLISWQEGEAWFWDTLVDADLGNNTVSWQWVAGCGADAAPFFRIFNPVLQGRKFDPDGAYVRRWVPELRGLPASHIHEPWAAPAAMLRDAGVTLDQTYPMPLIDLAEGRARALAALQSVTGRAS